MLVDFTKFVDCNSFFFSQKSKNLYHTQAKKEDRKHFRNIRLQTTAVVTFNLTVMSQISEILKSC